MPAPKPSLALAALSSALVLAACGEARPLAEQDTAAAACTACHGDPSRADADPLVQAAPPASVRGGDGGAHLAHLRGGGFRGPVACGECHAVPSSAGHLDGAVQLTFPGLGAARGATPRWDEAQGTCSGVYCHGATLAGGGATTPPWSSRAGLGCTSCHGYPPASHAPGSTDCGACHPGTVRSGLLDVANGLHVNGRVDVQNRHAPGWVDPAQHGRAAKKDLASCRACHGADYAGGTTGVSCNACHGGTAWQTSCTFCHGDPARPSNAAAPPTGTQGETATTARAVGAHAKHLSGGSVGPAVACAECHAVPANLSHVDGTAAVTFGAASRRGGAAPAWSGTTCSNTYCHGATLGAGGTKTAPAWTGGAAEAACGTCHGAPPPAPHTSSTSCGGCHDGYSPQTVNAATHMNGAVEASGGHPAGWAAKDRHGYTVNRSGLSSCKTCHGANLDGAGGTAQGCGGCHQSAGVASWQTSCTFCHGDRATGRASPPVDTQGRPVATNVSVGVHASHVGTALATPLACTECHASRAGSNVVTDAAHVDGDGIAEVSFGALARTGGAAATYARASATAATCASTYCHGRFAGGASSGAGATMSWTSTAQVGCTSCHGAPPSTGRHGKHSGRSCGDCHPGYGTSSVNAATHVNGSKQLGNRVTSYSAATRSCSNSCHGNETW